MKLTFILLFVFVSLNLHSQTNVGGVLNSNTNWTPAGSPYNLISNLSIPSGITLTIDPGVVINFDDNFQIIIQGSISAIGHSNNHISFNGNVFGSAMLLFQKTDLNKSSLSDITMEGPKDGIKLSNCMNDNNSGILAIDNLNVNSSKIETNGYNSGAELHLDNSNFKDTKIVGDYPYSERIFIHNGNLIGGQVISQDHNYGIFLFKNTSTGTYFSSGGGGSFLFMNDCDITNAVFESGAESDLDLFQCNAKNSSINDPFSWVTIRESNFTWDSDYSSPSESPWPCIIMGSGRIENSQLTGNQQLIAVVRGLGVYYTQNSQPLEIHHSTFTGFGTVLKINPGSQTGSGNGLVSIKYCKFYDTPQFNLIKNNSPYDIVATYNWWSTTSASDIDKLIYDYWDDLVFGEVDYSDYLTSPDMPITLSVSEDTLELPAAGGTATFNVISTVSWNMSVGGHWLTASQSSGKGNATITVTADENTGTQTRMEYVGAYTTGMDYQGVLILQEAPIIFSVSADTLFLPASASSGASFDIASNTGWNISCDQNWLTTDKSSGSDTAHIVVRTTANPHTSERTAKIAISGKTITSKTISIFQDAPQPLLSVSKGALRISYEAGNMDTFRINSNTDWNLSIDQTWLRANTLAGTDNESVYLIAEVNPATSERFAIITVSANGTESKSIIVIQNAAVVSAIEEDLQNTAIHIFPNPAYEKMTLSITEAVSDNTTLVISDLFGKTIYKSQVHENVTDFDLSAFDSGIYILKIYRKGYAYFTKKIIKL